MDTLITENGTELVVIQDGPRGPAGDGIRVLGVWNPATQYIPNDAVSWQSSASSVYTSLYIVNYGRTPVVGVAPNLAPLDWSELGLVAASAPLGAIWTVDQVAHGFTRVGTPVAFSVPLAKYVAADLDAPLLAVALVREIVNANQVILQSSGELLGVPQTVLLSGSWALGATYYLSTTAGLVTSTSPFASGLPSQPCFIVTQIYGAQLARVVPLNWGLDDANPASRTGPTPPANKQQGDLWFRTDVAPGLYVAVPVSGGGLTWAQANG